MTQGRPDGLEEAQLGAVLAASAEAVTEISSDDSSSPAPSPARENGTASGAAPFWGPPVVASPARTEKAQAPALAR